MKKLTSSKISFYIFTSLFIWIFLLYIGFINLNLFLSVTRPVPARIMIVEGWVSDQVLITAVDIFRRDHYRLLLTTGGPILQGDYLVNYKTYAGLATETVKRLGIKNDSIMTIPAQGVRVERTFAAATAVKQWLAQNKLKPGAVNLVTLGPHARRSWLIFRKVLGDRTKIGIIAAPDETYDDKRWWTSSNGFRSVIDEFVAYCYFKIIGRV